MTARFRIRLLNTNPLTNRPTIMALVTRKDRRANVVTAPSFKTVEARTRWVEWAEGRYNAKAEGGPS